MQHATIRQVSPVKYSNRATRIEVESTCSGTVTLPSQRGGTGTEGSKLDAATKAISAGNAQGRR